MILNKIEYNVSVKRYSGDRVHIWNTWLPDLKAALSVFNRWQSLGREPILLQRGLKGKVSVLKK